MNARSLKIDTHTAGRWLKRKLFPGLRIRGQWLAAAGFVPGRKVTVELTAPGEMRITQQQTPS